MRIALVHEFITQLGGAERVLQEFFNLYPEAKLYTLIYNGQKTNHLFDFYPRKTSFLQNFPFAKNHHRIFLPLMPAAIESFKFDGYNVVLADASAFAKGVKVPESTMFVCYCHTPTRYLWLESKAYVESLHYPQIIKKIIPSVLAWLRKWDHNASKLPNYYIANSKTVQERIKKIYNRESVVVYPPVDTEFFHPIAGGLKESYYFAASRLEPYKKIELVVEAFNDLGLPLKIAGSGTSSVKLRKMAKPNVEFLGRISDEELRRRYSEAQAFIFPANEDAGIMLVEAMSCGTPVIAYAAGGALETVKDGETGMFFKEQTSSAIKNAVIAFNPGDYNSENIRNHAKQFDKSVFRNKIKSLIDGWYDEFRNRH
jgi:glycosyltransferase involved in cell wall biosynthesis